MLHDVRQHQIVEVTGFNLMAGAGVFPQPIIGLANIIRLVNRFPHFSSKAVLPGSADFLIAYLHGFPTGGAVDKAVKQIVKGAAIPLHDGRAAVNQLLHPVPLFPADNGLVAILDNLPLVTGDEVHRVGANGLLVALANHMIALIDRVTEHFSNHRAAPRIIADFRFHRLFNACNRNFAL